MKNLPDKNRKEWHKLLTETGDLPFQNYFFKAKVIQLREQVAAYVMPLQEAVDELHELCVNMFDASFLQADLALIFDDFEPATIQMNTELQEDKMPDNAVLVIEEDTDVFEPVTVSGTEKEAEPVLEENDEPQVVQEELGEGQDDDVQENVQLKNVETQQVLETKEEKNTEQEMVQNTDLYENDEKLDSLELERKRAQKEIEKRLKEIQQNKNKKFVPKKKNSTDIFHQVKEADKKENKTKKKPLRHTSRRKKKGFWDNLFG